MELIDRYVHQVGRRLPQKTRADVEAELRSLLLDSIEERGHDDIETQVAVLKEFGRPEEMADRYRPRPRYVVGPNMYSIYFTIVSALALAGLVAGIVTAAVSALGAETNGLAWLSLVGQALALWWNIFITGVGVVTLIFAALERYAPDTDLATELDEAWDPRGLPEIEQHDEINVASLIAEIAFLAIFMVLLGGFAERINVGVFYDQGWQVVPGLFSQAFFDKYLPLMLVRWGLTIVLNLVLLRQGRWQTGTRLSDLALHALDIAILIWLLTGPAILNAEAVRQLLGGIDEGVLQLARRAFQIALGLGILGTLIEMAKKTWRLLGLGKPMLPETQR